MISRNLLTGTVVLLSACLANAGPCRPLSIVSSSTVVASASETATESETATSTASIDVTQTTTDPAESESTTETGTTVNVETTSSASSVETPTTALVDITTTTNPVTSAETTTTAAATTTSEEPEALQSIYLLAQGGDDPSLESSGGTGYSALSDTSSGEIKYIVFTTDVSSTLYFTLSERTGQVKVGNGPNAGNLLRYYAADDYSFALAAAPSIGDDSGLSPVDCNIAAENGLQQLQCQFADKGNAEFWTCDSNLVLVKPGVDFTSRCPRASTSYKLDYIQVASLFGILIFPRRFTITRISELQGASQIPRTNNYWSFGCSARPHLYTFPTLFNYDHYALEFQEIIASAKAVLDIRSSDKASDSLLLFTPEMGFIQPLFFATPKYRHSFWRKQALNLLRKSGREGPWCGDIEAQILEVVIAAEENTWDNLSSNLDESQQSMPSADVPEQNEDFLNIFKSYRPPVYQPGQSSVYSNAGISLVGLVVEAASNKAFDDAIKDLRTEDMFVPAGSADWDADI
ncbi:Transcriptional regulatory moc3 [Fusarium agapanthi]|uniref:Transcriptional regulatory moc3 n=1 Tax=Fusarium agapanthi TaxID=1803897 RepID=A0A9P5BEC3_9HYPO|nr:Transcriptional regulatory moc3 [Fusarium agapanthi]